MNAAAAHLKEKLKDMVVREAAKLRARPMAAADRSEIIEALESSLVKKGHSVRRMVWMPECCASLRLNCGHLVDLLVDDKTAVFVETDTVAAAKVLEHMPDCLAAGRYAEGILLHFSEELHTHALDAAETNNASP